MLDVGLVGHVEMREVAIKQETNERFAAICCLERVRFFRFEYVNICLSRLSENQLPLNEIVLDDKVLRVMLHALSIRLLKVEVVVHLTFHKHFSYNL